MEYIRHNGHLLNEQLINETTTFMNLFDLFSYMIYL